MWPPACFLQGDCGRVMVVLLTDGRANVSLAKSNRDPDAIAEDAPKPSTVRLTCHACIATCAAALENRLCTSVVVQLLARRCQLPPLNGVSFTPSAGGPEGGGHEHGQEDRRRRWDAVWADPSAKLHDMTTSNPPALPAICPMHAGFFSALSIFIASNLHC